MLWVLVSTRTWVCKIYISSRELEAILLNHKQEKYQKEAIMWIKIDILYALYALLIFSSRSFSYEFGNLLKHFWRNDFCFFLFLIRLFGHFNISISRIFSHFKWEFLVSAINVEIFSVVSVGQMRHHNFHWVKDLIVVLFLVELKYRAETSLKTTKIG